MKNFCPVACATWASVGVDMVMSMYGQTLAEPVPPPPDAGVVAVTVAECADSPAVFVAVTENVYGVLGDKPGDRRGRAGDRRDLGRAR